MNTTALREGAKTLAAGLPVMVLLYAASMVLTGQGAHLPTALLYLVIGLAVLALVACLVAVTFALGLIVRGVWASACQRRAN